MPAPSLKKMAKDAGVPYEDAERYWYEAKDSATEQGFTEGEEDFYAYVTGIVKKRMGMSSLVKSLVKSFKQRVQLDDYSAKALEEFIEQQDEDVLATYTKLLNKVTFKKGDRVMVNTGTGQKPKMYAGTVVRKRNGRTGVMVRLDSGNLVRPAVTDGMRGMVAKYKSGKMKDTGGKVMSVEDVCKSCGDGAEWVSKSMADYMNKMRETSKVHNSKRVTIELSRREAKALSKRLTSVSKMDPTIDSRVNVTTFLQRRVPMSKVEISLSKKEAALLGEVLTSMKGSSRRRRMTPGRSRMTPGRMSPVDVAVSQVAAEIIWGTRGVRRAYKSLRELDRGDLEQFGEKLADYLDNV